MTVPAAQTTDAAAPPEPEAAALSSDGADGESAPSRPPWTLQRRLILTVIAIVSLILIVVGIVTSVIVGRVLEDRVDQDLYDSVQEIGGDILRAGPGADANEVLESGRQGPGFLLTLNSSGETTGAWVSSPTTVTTLTGPQLSAIVAAPAAQFSTVSLGEGLGEYRIANWRIPNSGFTGVVGLPLTEVRQTIGQVLTTIAVVTLGGLLLLAIATAWTIRAGLAPLRAVADTASRVAVLPLDQGEVSIAERVPARQADPRTEVGRVGAALNTLLDHVGTSLDARQRNEERMRRFVADASHELRTPLASIRGYSELSLRDATLSENSEQALERIQAQSVRMTRIVEDLLLLARLDEGRELVYGTVDVSRLIVDAIGDAQAADADHVWHLEVGDEPVVIAGDNARLHQVVANLLANARTHTPAGTTVTASVSIDADAAILAVHDDGPGVDPVIRDELFERFARADTSRTRQTGGSGLGLSIARAIVEAHHGTIRVESEPGDTTFTVRLPLRAGAEG